MNGLLQNFAKLGVMRLAAVGGVGLAMIAFFIFVTTRLGTPGMSLLYAELDLKDSAQIVQKLDALGVPYQIRADGAQILVPGDQVAKIRMSMAEQGLPRGGSIGYELFDKSESFGTSTFTQNINQLRALEGELERTIGGLGAVQAARVHLVLPQRELFQREAQEASASIVVKLRGAQTLGKGQVAAIQHLVASAVPNLKPARVAILDGEGNLLARGGGDETPGVSGQAADELRVAYETRMARRVEDILQPSLGVGKVRVDVHADMDFDRITTSSETFDPDGQVVISNQTSSQKEENSTGSGDQPVTVANNLPNGQTPAANNSNNGRSKTSREDGTTNYGNSKTVRTQVHDGGEVKRLSVAVLVDGTYAEKDGSKTYTPRSPDEIKQITTLVRSAIGYNEKRGDTLEVVNLRFVAPEQPMAAAGASTSILGFDRNDIMRLGEMLVIAVVALLVILLVVRPLMFRLLDSSLSGNAPEPAGLLTDQSHGGAPALPAPPGMQSAIAGAHPAPMSIPSAPPRPSIDQMIDIGQVEGRVAASSIKKIGEIVEKHPEEAVAIVRSWMYQGA